VDQREMFMPTAAEMSKYPNDPDIRRMVTEHHQKRIERLREMVLQKREEIIAQDEQRSFIQRERGTSEEPEEDMDFLKAEDALDA
jgi:CRISPR/Cas system-associated endonuclease/helicase Cas3